jgi:hypothetical protein
MTRAVSAGVVAEAIEFRKALVTGCETILGYDKSKALASSVRKFADRGVATKSKAEEKAVVDVLTEAMSCGGDGAGIREEGSRGLDRIEAKGKPKPAPVAVSSSIIYAAPTD